jgi:hypothetical protein
VRAVVAVPGQTVADTIAFTPKGYGLYSAAYTRTMTAGTYRFSVEAHGAVTLITSLAPVQVPFTRQSEQGVYVTPPLIDDALIASKSVTLLDSARVISGGIVVNDAGGKIQVGTGVTTPAFYPLKADSIWVLGGSLVAGDLYYNFLSSASPVTGRQFTPLSLPVARTFPPFEAVTAELTTDLDVPNGATQTLTTRALRDVMLEPHSTVTLTGGVYEFRSLWMKSNTRLFFTAPTHVRIANAFRVDNDSYVGPATGSPITEADILFYVAASDSISFFSQAAPFGPSARIYANVDARYGTLLLEDGSTATGGFLGSRIVIGKRTEVRLKSSLVSLSKSAGGGWPLAPDMETPVPAELPSAFSLSQNFPNPFNPTTQIRYGLPHQTHVTLTIYNALGQELAQPVDEEQGQGFYEVRWNGTNREGLAVGSGIYFYRIVAGDYVETRKMALVR